MKALVVGGNGGIARALVEQLARRNTVDRVIATWHRTEPGDGGEKVRWVPGRR